METNNNLSKVMEYDKKADEIIANMCVGMMALAAIPAHVNWTIAAGVMATGVAKIGKCYGFTLSSNDSWKLVKQIFLSTGFTFMAINLGTKFIAAMAETTGIGYLTGVVLDVGISAAMGTAIGGCAKEYFHREFVGQNKMSKSELKELFIALYKEKKEEMKKEQEKQKEQKNSNQQ